jgi:hypothetical protein
MSKRIKRPVRNNAVSSDSAPASASDAVAAQSVATGVATLTPVDDAGALAAESPDARAARFVLLRSIPRRIRRRLQRRAATALIVVTPSAAWVDPVRAASRAVFGAGRSIDDSSDGFPDAGLVYFARERPDARGRPDYSGTGLPAHLARGGSAIGIAPDTTLLPPQLAHAADATVALHALRSADLAQIIRTTTGRKRCPRIDDALAASLDPADVASAVRAGDRPIDCVARLAAIAARKHAAVAEDVPRLEDLAGYGEAQAWGLALKADVEARRADPAAVSIDVITRSVLLAGPPGTGKTLFAGALARSCNIPLIATSYGEWQAGDAHMGIVMERIRASFAAARDAAGSCGAILFIDELDSIPGRDYAEGDRHSSWWSSLVNSLLTLAERGSPARRGVVLIGATNHANRIDAALLRAGRLDRTITLRLPDAETFAAMIRTHLGADLPGVDLVALARQAPGRTGADAAQIVRDARAVARQDGRDVSLADLISQIMPPETRPRALLTQIARHEAAHAVVGDLVGAGRLESVALCTPGADGAARFAIDPTTPLTRAALEARVVLSLAGRAMDELLSGAADAGAGGAPGSDLASATSLVAALHRAFGLGDSLITVGDAAEAAALLRVDRELRALVEADLQRLYAQAQALVAERRIEIEAIASALLRRRFMTGEQVRARLKRLRRAKASRPIEPGRVG